MKPLCKKMNDKSIEQQIAIIFYVAAVIEMIGGLLIFNFYF